MPDMKPLSEREVRAAQFVAWLRCMNLSERVFEMASRANPGLLGDETLRIDLEYHQMNATHTARVILGDGAKKADVTYLAKKIHAWNVVHGIKLPSR